MRATIRVPGVGGGGCNTAANMLRAALPGVEVVACNTDMKCLEHHPAERKIHLGPSTTRGLGAGGRPAAGQEAAEEVQPEIARAVEGADLVFIAAGMGGGTGTGAAPVVADIARERGWLTVAVVTRPIAFEGRRRTAKALSGIGRLRDPADTVVVIPNDRLLNDRLLNDRLLDALPEKVTVLEAFRLADEAIRAAPVHLYPNPTARAVREAVAAQTGMPPEAVVFGNGAADLLWTAVRVLVGVAAAVKLARRLEPGKLVVAILPDTGRNYLGKFFADTWMREKGFLGPEPEKATTGDVLRAKQGAAALLSISPNDVAFEAVRRFEEHGISQLPVIAERRFVGSINEITLAKLLHDGVDLRSKHVSEVMGKPLPTVDEATDIAEPYRLLLAGHGGVVVTRAAEPVGFLARIDLVEFWAGRLERKPREAGDEYSP